MRKIRRKRIFEDDQVTLQQPAQQNQQQQQQPQQNQQQQPGQQTQQQQNNNVQQTAQQTNQQQQQIIQQATQPNQYSQKVTDVLKKMENTYWIMSVNLPEEIQKEIPDFKQGNAMADPIIKLWNDFKAAPDQNKFNAFIDAFKNFGNTSINPSTNQQQAVNAGLKAAYSFNKKLMENLAIAKQRNYYTSLVSHYFNNDDDFSFEK